MDSGNSSPNKPPLILLHGFRGSPLGLSEVADVLRADGYEVYTPAVPPFSGAALPSFTPEAYVSFVNDFIEEHSLEKPILMGHSMGSIIAAAVAHTDPSIIHQKLILLSPISARTTRLVAPLVPLSAGMPRLVTDYVTTRFLFVPHDPKLFRKTLAITNQCSGDQVPRAREVFLAGESDRIVNKKNTEQLAEEIGAKLEFIPGSGHLHNYEKPKETAEAILRFLAE